MRRFVFVLAATVTALAAGVAPAAPEHVAEAALPPSGAVAYNPVDKSYVVALPALNQVAILRGTGAASPAGSPPAPAAIGLAADTTRIQVGRNPQGVAVHERLGLVFVTSQDAGTISVIAGGAVVRTYNARQDDDSRPWGIDVDEDRNMLCVAMFGENEVWVLDALSGAFLGEVPVEAGPIGVAAGGGNCYVTSFYQGWLHKISLATFTEIARALSVPGLLGACPWGASPAPGAGALYVANFCDHSVSYVNPVNLGVLRIVPLGAGAAPIGIDSSDVTVYVSESGRDRISLLSAVSGDRATKVSGIGPHGVATGAMPECTVAAHTRGASLYCDAR